MFCQVKRDDESDGSGQCCPLDLLVYRQFLRDVRLLRPPHSHSRGKQCKVKHFLIAHNTFVFVIIQKSSDAETYQIFYFNDTQNF